MTSFQGMKSRSIQILMNSKTCLNNQLAFVNLNNHSAINDNEVQAMIINLDVQQLQIIQEQLL